MVSAGIPVSGTVLAKLSFLNMSLKVRSAADITCNYKLSSCVRVVQVFNRRSSPAPENSPLPGCH
jgi:hypothetical protein